MNRLIIIGAGGHGKVIADAALKNGYTNICYIDDHAIGDVMGFPIIGTSADIEHLNDGSTDFETIYCLWIICDFIDKTEYHSSSDFPVNAVFFAEGELYELSFIPENKEAMFEQAFKTQEPDGKRIIVLESTEQIPNIKIPDVAAYCTVNDSTGEVKYFRTGE